MVYSTALTRLTDNDIDDTSPTFSPDGGRIAFLRETGDDGYDLYLMAANGTGVERVRTTGDLDPGGLDWHPDGQTVAVVRRDADFDTDLWAVELAGGTMTRLLRAPNTQQYLPRYSPDGSELAFISYGRRPSLLKIPAGGGTPVTVAGGSDLFVDSFAFAPDSSTVLVSVLAGDPHLRAPEVRSCPLDGSSHTLVVREFAGTLAWGQCAPGGCALTEPAPTALTVSGPLQAGGARVTVFASTAPLHVCAELNFTYYKRRADGTWREIGTERATIEPFGFARASFPRFDRGRCRTTVSFPGDHDHLAGRGTGGRALPGGVRRVRPAAADSLSSFSTPDVANEDRDTRPTLTSDDSRAHLMSLSAEPTGRVANPDSDARPLDPDPVVLADNDAYVDLPGRSPLRLKRGEPRSP